MRSPARTIRSLAIALATALVLGITPVLIFAMMADSDATWYDHQPPVGEWVTELPVTTQVRAENPVTLSADATYRYSLDEGSSWTPWQTDNLQVSSEISTRRIITVTTLPFAEGENLISYRITDTTGLVSTSGDYVVSVDTVAPSSALDAVATPESWSNIDDFGAAWTNPADTSGIAGVWYKVGAAPGSTEDGIYMAGEAISSLSGITVGGDGQHSLWLWLQDNAGNADHTTAISLQLFLDTIAPGSPLAAPIVTPSGWQTQSDATFSASWLNPNDMSGIASACYKLGNEPESDLDGTCVAGDGINMISEIIAPAPGSYHFFVWLQDRAGNIDHHTRQVTLDAIKWDDVAPEIFIDPLGPQGRNGWYVGAIDATIIARDTGSGLAKVEYRLDGAWWREGRQVTIDTEGAHSLVARAIDVAGNFSNAGPEDLNLDSLTPRTTAVLNRTPVFEDWYDSIVTVTFYSQDATSGVDFVAWKLDDDDWQQSNSMQVSEDGEHLLHFYGEDNAGNTEEEQTKQIKIDRLPPVTSYVILPGTPTNGWYTEPVVVTLVPADDGVGVAATYYRVNDGTWQRGTEFTLSESGEHQVEFYSVDYMGHTEASFQIPGGIRIDADAPRAPTPVDVQPKGWTNTNDFELVLAVPPDLSGIDGAYYKVGQPPTEPEDGIWQAGSGNIISNVQVSQEGQHKAYVWLKDVAGNLDHNNHGIWQEELALFYDVTPPETSADLSGIAGDNDWFTSAVSVTLVSTDTLSGVAGTIVSINGGEPVTETEFELSEQDKHTVRYSSADHAGNEETSKLATVRIDTEAPGSPGGVRTSPEGWTHVNSFTIQWSNPSDTSGIARGYFKLGEAPLHAHDGTAVAPIGLATSIKVPAEGAWDLHFWLEDHAGNADITSRVTRAEAYKYDGTPPSTAVEILAGELSSSGWYVSDVLVRLSAADQGSGVTSLRYRLGEAEWTEIEGDVVELEIDTTGRHILEYQAIDLAGNREPEGQQLLRVDLHPPVPQFLPIDRYQRDASFVLSWAGTDESDGSGLDGFDLQYRDGRNGPWLNWGGSNVPDTSARFYGNLGHRYFFHMRAHDRAGNVSGWSEMFWGVYTDALLDGGFDGGSFGAWQNHGELDQDVISDVGPNGDSVFAAQLGSPDYGPNVPGFDIPSNSTGSVPVGAGAVSQTVLIPGADVLDHPTLTLWYHMYTYDTAYGNNQQKWYDTFDVVLEGPTGEMLALRDGLPYDEWQEGELADLAWRYIQIPIPQSWAGQTVTIRLENWNREDGRLNTWTDVTDIRLWEPYRVILPFLAGPAQDYSVEPRGLDQVLRAPTGGLR